jgi:hypothetical protein
MPVKVYTMSDLHVDYHGNMQHLLNLKHPDYADSTLIVSGDCSDKLDKLSQLLCHFKTIFAEVFFVPGNHELWVRDDKHAHSIDKFESILRLCQNLGVHTQPVKIGSGEHSVWIVPMFSWYTKPGEGDDNLFEHKDGNDITEEIWSDNRFCRWDPLAPDQSVVDYFLALNTQHVERQYDAPVISFSHFLPLKELSFVIGFLENGPKHFIDPLPEFNFTRVAGTSRLAAQIKQAGSVMHIHGHQHRNRHRDIDGITHISHCLGYPKERQNPHWRGTNLPKQVWHDGKIDVEQPF